jgi:hypothetical protein|tara:strand:- start:1011 stop:1451 length:441 start_codon:yes stop_codon:yes gene_type:complete
MKRILMSILLLSFVQTSYAGHHEQKDTLALEKRQADSQMTMTSLMLGDTETIINAKGTMGEYGTVYVTYKLSYNADRVSGFVSGTGRGAINSDTVVGGAFRGVWTRKGSIVQIRQVVQISDGSQNLDVIDIDMLSDTFIIKAYTLK